jgi:chromosome segregation ATPase
MKDLKMQVAERESAASKAIEQADEMKGRLQDSFKEFIAMDETMIQLRIEAVKGSEAVEMRNTMLQKNLTKLTGDFEVTSRELRSVSNKIRELEYELEQMVNELNVKGEALRKSNILASGLKDNFDNCTQELKELRQAHDYLTMAKSKVEAEAGAEATRNEQQKSDLRKSLKKTSGELETSSRLCTDQAYQIKVRESEIEGLKKNLSSLTRERDGLSDTLSKTRAKSEKEIAKLNETIVDLNALIAKHEAQIKLISEKREQLMFEVTDLQNALDDETTKGTNLFDEMNSLKKTTDEKIALLTDQVEKLSSSKQVLANDKKELTEKVKALRQQLKDRGEELERTNKEWDEKYEAQSEILTNTENSLSSLRTEHKNLNEKFNLLSEKYSGSVKDNIVLKIDKENAAKKQQETDLELLGVRNSVAELLERKANLIAELGTSKKNQEQLLAKYSYENELAFAREEASSIFKANAESCIKDRDAEIQRLLGELVFLRQDRKTLKSTQSNLENKLSDTEFRLAETIKSLMKETETKETIEQKLNELRLQWQHEKRIRAELERTHFRLKYIGGNRETNHLTESKTRDRKLLDVSVGLEKEAKRLAQLVELLPKKYL